MCIRLHSFLLSAFFILSISAFPQNERIREIYIEKSGITAVSSNLFDTLITDKKNNAIVFCYQDSSKSFWYKINVQADCEIAFDIFPYAEKNIYNFFFYKVPDSLTPYQVKIGNVEPFRANLLKDEMYFSGTGLSTASLITGYDTSSKIRTHNFYHTPYHSSVLAKSGDVFLLNIYHMKGNDCGHHFNLKIGLLGQKFNSIIKACYSAELANMNVRKDIVLKAAKSELEIISPKQTAVKKPEQPFHQGKEAIATFVVRDSSKHLPLEAEVNSSRQKGIKPSFTFIEKGKYEMKLAKNTGYHFTFSSLGYKNMDVFFLTDDSLKSFTNDVYLVPCKVGDNFVMDKIYFYPNSYDMKAGALTEVDKLVAYLKANPEMSIEIQGHTNGNKRIKRSYDSNFSGSSKKLSQIRAEKIKKYLMYKGISADRLTAIGHGGSKMIFEKPKNQNEANKNIRVEVLILSKKEAPLATGNAK